MSQITRLIQALAQPVALEPTVLRTLAHVFRRKLAGEAFTGHQLHAELGIQDPNARPKREPAKVAVIPVYGVVAQHAQSLGASTDDIGVMVDAAVANPNIDAILLDIDSPGGEIVGLVELHAKLLAARATKPILALANSLAASAAYWIASAATEIMVTPSGMVGSIGVYVLHEDLSKHLEQEGIKLTAISAGKFKTEGAPWEPLSEEAHAKLQARVTEVYGWFIRDVAKGRGVTPSDVRTGYGEGRVLGAKEALEAGLVDRIGTFDDGLERLRARKPLRKGSRAQASRALDLDAAAVDPTL